MSAKKRKARGAGAHKREESDDETEEFKTLMADEGISQEMAELIKGLLPAMKEPMCTLELVGEISSWIYALEGQSIKRKELKYDKGNGRRSIPVYSFCIFYQLIDSC